MDYLVQFGLSLFLTIFIEFIALFALARLYFKWTPKRMSNRLLLFCGIFCSFCTLPYVWFVLPGLISSRMPYIAVAESFAVLAESLIYLMVLRIGAREAFILSLACNMLSFGIGLLLL